jgi:hypothetical protein
MSQYNNITIDGFMSAENFLDMPGKLAIIEDQVLMDHEFIDLCNVLSIPPNIRLRFAQDL